MLSMIQTSFLFLFLLHYGQSMSCPTNISYNKFPTVPLCYKVNNGSYKSWNDARLDCMNDTEVIRKTLNMTGISRLLALENYMEKNALSHWLLAYNINNSFWTDGMMPSSTWNYTGAAINWFFNSSERSLSGNKSNLKYAYNNNISLYQIVDEDGNTRLNHICEYQEPCPQNNSCLNGATCYLSLDEDICLCPPGYTGSQCEIDVDYCLSAPCQNSGTCTNQANNYTCNCNETAFEGDQCENPKPDPQDGDRTTAFWSVIGIVSGILVLLTLSDLPWIDLFTLCGCSSKLFKRCSKKNARKEIIKTAFEASNQSTIDDQSPGKTAPAANVVSSKGANYYVITKVWSLENKGHEASTKTQYDGYRSPDPHTVPADDDHSPNFAAAPTNKSKENNSIPVHTTDPTHSETQTKHSPETTFGWTQQLQEHLRNKSARQSSAGSTNQLISSSNTSIQSK